MRTLINPAKLLSDTFPCATAESDLTGTLSGIAAANLGALQLGAQLTVIERDALILENLPVVRSVARQLLVRMPQSVELEDLISAGMVGLLDAATKFDGSKQVQFKSYAQFRIRGAILDSLRTLDWSPRELRRKGRVLAEAIRSLSGSLGRTPTDAEIAGEMGLSLESFHHMTGELKGLEISSLNQEHSEEADTEELDFLVSPAEESPFALYAEAQTRERLAAVLALLPEKERLVLNFYYYEGMTLKEIGLALGVVESRVSQIRSSALRRLRKALGDSQKGKKLGQSRPRTH